MSSQAERARRMAQRYDAWIGMPGFIQEDARGVYRVNVLLRTPADVAAFEALVGQKVRRVKPGTAAMWFPAVAPVRFRDYGWVAEDRDAA